MPGQHFVALLQHFASFRLHTQSPTFLSDLYVRRINRSRRLQLSTPASQSQRNQHLVFDLRLPSFRIGTIWPKH
jgi:hypothetical protein